MTDLKSQLAEWLSAGLARVAPGHVPQIGLELNKSTVISSDEALILESAPKTMAIIGAVGSTGRATGPHLHWAAQLRRARFDPGALLTLPVGD